MEVTAETKIKIAKGDPEEVLAVVRTKESVIDLSTVATGKHHHGRTFKYGSIHGFSSPRPGRCLLIDGSSEWGHRPDYVDIFLAIDEQLTAVFPRREEVR